MSCVFAPAGFVNGPRMLNTVRTPTSLRMVLTFFIAGWKLGANMNPMPSCSMLCSTISGLMLRFNPSRSRTSALPHWLVNDLFPCLATLTPAPAMTKAHVVLTLNVFVRSPPVPQVSRRHPSTLGRILLLNSRIVSASAVTSSTVSRFFFNATRKAAT